MRWRPAWRFPKETEEHLADILRSAPRPILHVCAGASRLGDVRADMYHPAPDVRGDMYQLPFKDGAFGATVADPPFPLDGVALHQRLAQFNEMGRVTRSGGLVVLHAPWLPSPTWASLEGAWFRETGGHAFPQAPLIISAWRVSALGVGERARLRAEAHAGRVAA